MEVEAVVLDSGPGASASEPTEEDADPVRAAVNARMATQDSTAIAYIGELDSAATLTSLPITNDARMLQVSPTAGAVELVAPFEGSDEVPARDAAVRRADLRHPRRARAASRESWGRRRWPSCSTRSTVRTTRSTAPRSSEAFLATGERDSPLGPYSIDELGRAEPD